MVLTRYTVMDTLYLVYCYCSALYARTVFSETSTNIQDPSRRPWRTSLENTVPKEKTELLKGKVKG